MSKLIFLGTSDAFNAAGRANSCYWVEDTHGRYMVDFGPTALLQCHRHGLDVDTLDGIFLTHLHGDHIGGLAILLVHLQFQVGRTRPFVIAGPDGTRERVRMLIESAYPSVLITGFAFDVDYVFWDVPGEIEILGRQVRAIRARHDRLAIATSLRINTQTHSISFSGDTGWQPELADLVDGSDLFVCECTNLDGDYWAHLSVEEHLRLRERFKVKAMYLSHLSEMAREAMVGHASALNLTVADDGMVIEFN
ncbi:MAG: MBL fold metallo-hydrolase [Myxococcota bacterium]|nr:MBL fold metallo-hydrolase [Myxococcota bacterium]